MTTGAEARTPFGLTFGDAPSERHRADPRVRRATLDPERQIAVIDGRPITETEHFEALAGSSPTETDGQDPIAVDSDPIYD